MIGGGQRNVAGRFRGVVVGHVISHESLDVSAAGALEEGMWLARLSVRRIESAQYSVSWFAKVNHEINVETGGQGLPRIAPFRNENRLRIAFVEPCAEFLP